MSRCVPNFKLALLVQVDQRIELDNEHTFVVLTYSSPVYHCLLGIQNCYIFI